MQHQTKLSAIRAQNLARFGQWVAGISAVMILGYGCYLLATPAEAMFLLSQAVPQIQVTPSQSVLTVLAIVAAIPALLFLLCLHQVCRFFGFVRRGQVFDEGSLSSLRLLGRLAIACALAGILCRTAVGLLATSNNPPGQKMLVIGISSNELLAGVTAVLIFVFANIVREAAAAIQENKSFV
jgi:hypothetical protein